MPGIMYSALVNFCHFFSQQFTDLYILWHVPVLNLRIYPFVYFLFKYLFLFIFWPYQVLVAACGILVPQPGIRPTPPVMEAWNLNNWTAREVP